MIRAIDKLEPFQKAISKAHLASAGVSMDALDTKPIIAVANSWNEICPGHEPLKQLAAEVKKGILEAGGEPVEFTGAEYRLLCLLLQNSGRILTRGVLLDRLWDGAGNFVDDNTLSVYVRRLREKLEKNPSKPEHLITVRGSGYQWKE